MERGQDADEFIGRMEREETAVERNARHYADSAQRYASVTAVTELAASVASIAKAQTENSSGLALLRDAVGDMKEAMDKMTSWMEGSISADGVRKPGFIDQIGLFSKWKGTITALLTAGAVGAVGTCVVATARLIWELTRPALVGGH